MRHSRYEAVPAADGQLALEVLAEDGAFDLVLLDFVMPRVNGYQFCRALRTEERFRTLPVVLMSAKGDRIREQFVHQTGAIDAIATNSGHGTVFNIHEPNRLFEVSVRTLKTGDRVCCKVHHSCGICRFCRNGMETACPSRKCSTRSVSPSCSPKFS